MMEQVNENKYVSIGDKLVPLLNRRCRKITPVKDLYPINCLRRIACMLTSLEKDKVVFSEDLPNDVFNVWTSSVNQLVTSLRRTHAVLRRAIHMTSSKRVQSRRLDRKRTRTELRSEIEEDKLFYEIDSNNSRTLITDKYQILDNDEVVEIVHLNQKGLLIGSMETVTNQTTERVELSPLVSETIDLCDFIESPESTISISNAIDLQNADISIYAVDNMLKSILTTDELVQLGYYNQTNVYYEDVYTLVKRDKCVSTFQGKLLTNNGHCEESAYEQSLK